MGYENQSVDEGYIGPYDAEEAFELEQIEEGIYVDPTGGSYDEDNHQEDVDLWDKASDPQHLRNVEGPIKQKMRMKTLWDD